MTFPDKRDHREIALTSTSSTATGTERTDTALFSFDRVFEPRANQDEVFEDVGQLVQSVTDGYNCTIFSYGQTGSGKTWTMEGGKTVETMGMIPRAVKQVFDTAESARAQGWDYTMEGQFLEIVGPSLPPFLRLVNYCWGNDSTTKRSTIYSGRVSSTNASTRLSMIRVDGRPSRRSLPVCTPFLSTVAHLDDTVRSAAHGPQPSGLTPPARTVAPCGSGNLDERALLPVTFHLYTAREWRE